MAEKKLGGAGLRGQSAGETALCTVGKEGAGLTYRGYGIDDLGANDNGILAPMRMGAVGTNAMHSNVNRIRARVRRAFIDGNFSGD